MNTIIITPFQPGQEVMVYNLVRDVYDEFVSGDYTDEGNAFFYQWIKPSFIAARQQIQNTMFIACVNNEPAGVIEMRDNRNISLLFVVKKHQLRGIAKLLFRKAVMMCLQKDPSLDIIYVHASPYSIPVYTRLGFSATGAMQIQNGIRYLPMAMTLSHDKRKEDFLNPTSTR